MEKSLNLKNVFSLFKKINKDDSGSLSLEAAVSLPFFIFAIIALLSWLEIFRAYTDIETTMCQASRQVALFSGAYSVSSDYTDDDGLSGDYISMVLTDGYAYAKLMTNYTKNNGQSIKVTDGRLSLLSLSQSHSSVSQGYIDYSLNYSAAPLINTFNLFDVPLYQRFYLHTWTGYSLSDNSVSQNDERIVYITETGTVYHLSKACSYLKLSITPVNASEIEDLRNSSGATYKPCELCNPEKTGLLYITDYGDKYHCSLTCSGLKRTINEVPLSSVQDTMNCCSRCMSSFQ